MDEKQPEVTPPVENGLKPDEIKIDEVKPVEKPESQKRWGMPDDQAQQFFGLVFLGLERMSQRQRTMFRRAVKAASRDLNALWPHGKPMDVISQEAQRAAAEHAAKPQIIIPQGVNADALKQQP